MSADESFVGVARDLGYYHGGSPNIEMVIGEGTYEDLARYEGDVFLTLCAPHGASLELLTFPHLYPLGEGGYGGLAEKNKNPGRFKDYRYYLMHHFSQRHSKDDGWVSWSEGKQAQLEVVARQWLLAKRAGSPLPSVDEGAALGCAAESGSGFVPTTSAGPGRNNIIELFRKAEAFANGLEPMAMRDFKELVSFGQPGSGLPVVGIGAGGSQVIHPPVPKRGTGGIKPMAGCDWCHAPAEMKCSRCMSVRYCGVQCQKAHFKEHKAQCTAVLLTPQARLAKPL